MIVPNDRMNAHAVEYFRASLVAICAFHSARIHKLKATIFANEEHDYDIWNSI